MSEFDQPDEKKNTVVGLTLSLPQNLINVNTENGSCSNRSDTMHRAENFFISKYLTKTRLQKTNNYFLKSLQEG